MLKLYRITEAISFPFSCETNHKAIAASCCGNPQKETKKEKQEVAASLAAANETGVDDMKNNEKYVTEGLFSHTLTFAPPLQQPPVYAK